MFRTIQGSDQANSVKNTEMNKQLYVKFWLNRKKYEAVSYLFSCNLSNSSSLYLRKSIQILFLTHLKIHKYLTSE